MVTLEEQKILDHERTMMLTKCKCGHTIAMPFADRTICSHCKKWVYRDKKAEFLYKMKQELKKVEKNEAITKRSI